MKPSSIHPMAVTTRLGGVGGIIMRVAVVAAILCLSVLDLSAVSSAQAAVRHSTSIAPQGLGPALQALAKARNFQLIYRSELVNNLQTQGASGELTSDEALTQLLSGTGLTFRYLDDRTVTVFPVSSTHISSDTPTPATGEGGQDPHQRASDNGSRKSFWDRVRLAQADQAPRGTDASSASKDQETTDESRASRIDDQVDLGEIVVTGTNIRGVHPSSSPVEIYTAEDIARSGATTTEQFIQKLPQNLGTLSQNTPAATASINNEGVNSINLRGLGLGTTLTLLNGRRLALASSGRAADISLIPASAIERIEVLTDGASAIYGADAVGGVVNFVLREDFQGAQTSLGYGGVTSGGLRQFGATQTLGHGWASGNALVSLDYHDASPLLTSERDYARPVGPGLLTPDDRRRSALATASQTLGERLVLNGDFAFSRREVENLFSNLTSANPLSHFRTQSRSETEQHFYNLGADLRLTESLDAAFIASYSKIDVDSGSLNDMFNRGTMSAVLRDTDHSALDLTATLGGTLFALPAGALRFSVGAGRLDEEYRGARTVSGQVSNRDLGRETTYVFAELFAPLVGNAQDIPFVHRLELSLAARYTRYEDASDPSLTRDFGSRTSPKVGVLWAPVPALALRATYGESFRAPTLTEIDPTGGLNALQTNRLIGGVSSTIMVLAGVAPDIDTEIAQNFTLGLDFRPLTQPNLRFSLTYFDIDYDDRIAAADTVPGRANPAAWPDVVYQPASAAQIEAFLRANPTAINQTDIPLTNPQTAAAALFALQNFWIVDGRSRNLSLTELDGFDLGMNYRLSTPLGEISVGGQFTRILDFREQATSTAPVIMASDTVLRPVSFRGRIFAGLDHGSVQTTVGINYADDYSDPYNTGTPPVDSWTTVDLSLIMNIGRHTPHGLLQGVTCSLSVQNLFDEDPPFVDFSESLTGLINSPGFDPTNANPLGRLVFLGVSKTW